MVMLTAACARWLPWRNEPVGNEVNLAFTLENNLLFLPSARIDNREGRYFLATAARTSAVDANRFPAGARALNISEKQSLRFTPARLDLGGVGDAMIGADVWGSAAVTIDYRSGLVTYQREGIYPGYMTLFRFEAEPTVLVSVDGRNIGAVVDTASPDTLILPGTANTRGTARVVIAGTDFGTVDVQYANVTLPRIGNRLLSRFLVTIDYGKRQVGLWRDPRIP